MTQVLVLCVVAFVLVHVFKMMRLYLVLMEHGIGFGQFLLLYFRTTAVNFIVPFKLGELYRIEEVARKTKVWQVGVLSVVVDRFFDTLALLCWLLPIDIFLEGKISGVSIVLVIVICLLVLVYVAIPGSYQYLNRYLIMRKASKRSMAALRSLDVIGRWYEFTKNLITGRAALICGASFLGWGAELVTLTALGKYVGQAFGIGDFGSYIRGIFAFDGASAMLKSYTYAGAIAFAALTVMGYFVLFTKKLGNKNTKHS